MADDFLRRGGQAGVMTMLRHEPKDGVLCWGGPHHGEVHPLPDERRDWLFAVERRAPMRVEDTEPIGLRLPTVRYDMEKWGVEWADGTREVWFVLVYPENKERHIAALTGCNRLLWWMCAPLNEWTEGEA